MAKKQKQKRGPKPKFLEISCPNPNCKHHGKKGLGNIISNGTYRTRSTGKARLFLCRTYGKAFSSRTGTAFFGLRSPKKKVLMGLKLLAEGLGLRGTSRVLEVKLDTVRGWLSMAAGHCEQVTDMLLRDLRLSQVQWMSFGPSLKKHQNPIEAMSPGDLLSHKRGEANVLARLGSGGPLPLSFVSVWLL